MRWVNSMDWAGSCSIPKRLVRMFLRREAEYSSRIENTFAGVRTMLLFQDQPSIENDFPSVREVHNNFLALDYAVCQSSDRPLSCALIKELHQILLAGVRGQDKTPGAFRTVQAHIGTSSDIANARFVPAPPLQIEPKMQELEQYLRGKDDLPPIIRVAMVHYQFEAIHPFADGNGRIGRVLMLLQLIREGAVAAPLLNPSALLEMHRREYYDHLLSVSERGEWNAWCRFFAECLEQEAISAMTRIEKMEALRETYHQKLSAPRVTALLFRFIDELFIEPNITAKALTQKLSTTLPTAQSMIDKLVAAGILREVTGQQRRRVYLATEIVDLFADRDSR